MALRFLAMVYTSVSIAVFGDVTPCSPIGWDVIKQMPTKLHHVT
jgi:hypothetical protein